MATTIFVRLSKTLNSSELNATYKTGLSFRGIHFDWGPRLNFHIFLSQGPTGEIDLVEGQTFKLSLRKEDFERGDSDMIYVDYANLGKAVNKGSKIFMDDGLICLRVKEIADDHVITVVENSGKLGSKKGVNLPEAIVDLPAISDKDKVDIMFGVENGVSWKLLGPRRYIYSLRLYGLDL